MSKDDEAWDFKIEVTKKEEDFKVKPKSHLTQIIRVSPQFQKETSMGETKNDENKDANRAKIGVSLNDTKSQGGLEKDSFVQEAQDFIVQELSFTKEKTQMKSLPSRPSQIVNRSSLFVEQKEELPDYLKPDRLPDSTFESAPEEIKKKPRLKLEKTQTFIVTRRQMAEERTQLRLGLNLPAANDVRLKSMSIDFGIFLLIFFSSGKISFIIFTPICHFLSDYINKGNLEYIKHLFASSITDPVFSSWWMGAMTFMAEQSASFLKFIPSFMSAFIFLGLMMYFFVLPLARQGKSPGKNICKIRVSHEDGSNLSITEAFRREIFYKFLSGISLIGPFLFLKEGGKSLHDKMASSVVLVDRRQQKRSS